LFTPLLQPHLGFDTMLSQREVHEATESFCIRDANGQALFYVYFEGRIQPVDATLLRRSFVAWRWNNSPIERQYLRHRLCSLITRATFAHIGRSSSASAAQPLVWREPRPTPAAHFAEECNGQDVVADAEELAKGKGELNGRATPRRWRNGS
jgi:hypothetical protein